MTVKLGYIIPIENVLIEFGENKKGYVGGYVMFNDNEPTPIIFTPREISLAINRAKREEDNFLCIEVQKSIWTRVKEFLA